MGRNESSSAGAIAVIVIAGVLVLLLVAGVVVLGGFFFMARSSPQALGGPGSITVSSAPATAIAGIVIEADEDGTVLINGEPHSDEEYREFLRQHFQNDQESTNGRPREIVFKFNGNVSTERQVDIGAMYYSIMDGYDQVLEAVPPDTPEDESDVD